MLFCDTATGEPLLNKEFLLVKVNQNQQVDRVLEGRTNRNGLYVFDEWELSQLDHTLLLLDRKDRGLTAVRVPYDPDYYGYRDFLKRDMPSTQPLRSITDRPVYRPGDTGFLKIATGPEPRPVTLEIKRTKSTIPFLINGSEASTLTTEPDIYGGCDGQFNIPNDIAPGAYAINAISGKQTTGTRFVVAEHTPPKIRLSAATFLPAGEIVIAVKDIEGNPVANAETSLSLSFSPQSRGSWCPKNTYDTRLGRGFWWHGGQFEYLAKKDDTAHPDLHAETLQHTDTNGRLSINLADFDATDLLHSPGVFNIHAEVSSGEETLFKKWIKLPSLLKRSPLCCWLDKAFYDPSESIDCHVAAEQPFVQAVTSISSAATPTTAMPYS